MPFVTAGKENEENGHGPIGGKKELTEYRDVIVTIRDRVSALKKQGKSLDEVVATKPGAAYEAKWGGSFYQRRFLYQTRLQGRCIKIQSIRTSNRDTRIKSMKIVVIGGTGLFGTKLVNNLRGRGHEVLAASPHVRMSAYNHNPLLIDSLAAFNFRPLLKLEFPDEPKPQ